MSSDRKPISGSAAATAQAAIDERAPAARLRWCEPVPRPAPPSWPSRESTCSTGGPMRAAVMHAFREPLRIEEVPEPALPRRRRARRGARHGAVPQRLARLDGPRRRRSPSPTCPGTSSPASSPRSAPEVRGVTPGDRVTAPFCCGCGACEPCRQGHTQICERDYQPGFTGWGSFAERVLVPGRRPQLRAAARRAGLRGGRRARLPLHDRVRRRRRARRRPRPATGSRSTAAAASASPR